MSRVTDEQAHLLLIRPRFFCNEVRATFTSRLTFSTSPHRLSVETFPRRLSYFYNGLDQKLVGVEGAEPIRQVI